MLRVATRVFSKRGFHAASMDEIAEGAGISKPMVYAYFGSKEGLYVACIRAAGELLREEIARGAEADVPPDQQMWQGSLAFFRFVARQPEGWRVLYREASVEGGPSAADSVHQFAIDSPAPTTPVASASMSAAGTPADRASDRAVSDTISRRSSATSAADGPPSTLASR